MLYNLDGIFDTFGGNTMNDMIRIDDEYIKWLKNIKNRFKKTQIKAAIKVNEEMLRFYWSLGRDIVEMQAESKWGSSFFDTSGSATVYSMENSGSTGQCARA